MDDPRPRVPPISIATTTDHRHSLSPISTSSSSSSLSSPRPRSVSPKSCSAAGSPTAAPKTGTPTTPAAAGITPFVLKAVAIASLGGILFGYDLGCVSGALPQVSAAFSLTQRQKESVVSFLYLGAGFGAAVGGYLCDAHGRRTAILITDVLFLLGASVLYLANGFHVVLVGRFVVGFAVSVSGCADVAYLTEISPPAWRGSVVSCNEACISLGFLLAYASGYLLSGAFPEDGWRIMFGASGIVAAVQFVGMLPMPESPVWLSGRGRDEEAKKGLMQIHEFGSAEVASEYYDKVFRREHESDSDRHGHYGNDEGRTILRRRTDAAKRVTNAGSPLTDGDSSVSYSSFGGGGGGGADGAAGDAPPNDKLLSPSPVPASDPALLRMPAAARGSCLHGWSTLIFELRWHRRQAIVAVFLSAAQQFCGHTNVLNFAPEIFAQAGLGNGSSSSSLAATLLLGAVKFLVTLLVIWKVDLVGRRVLLLLGTTTMAVSLFLMVIAFRGDEIDTVPAVAGAVGIAVGYASSFGPLTWLVTSEMFPAMIRGRALGASTIVTYVCAVVVSYTFLSVQDSFGPSVPFALYLAVTVLSVAFAAVAIPDTGGNKSPAAIDEEMAEMWFWRRFFAARAVDEGATTATDDHSSAVTETSYISHEDAPEVRRNVELPKVV